jgi:hypothetical protein
MLWKSDDGDTCDRTSQGTFCLPRYGVVGVYRFVRTVIRKSQASTAHRSHWMAKKLRLDSVAHRPTYAVVSSARIIGYGW